MLLIHRYSEYISIKCASLPCCQDIYIDLDKGPTGPEKDAFTMVCSLWPSGLMRWPMHRWKDEAQVRILPVAKLF